MSDVDSSKDVPSVSEAVRDSSINEGRLSDEANSWSPLSIGVWLALAIVIGLPFTWALAKHSFGPPRTLNDFVQEWTSARNFFAGEPVYLPLKDSMPKHFGKEIELGVIEVNAHPPASVFISLPFCKFGYKRALHLWNAVSLIALLIAIAMMFSSAGLGWSGWYSLPVFTLLATSNPLAQQMLQGQLNLVLLLLLTGFWIAARHNHWWLSGILVGIAGAIKLFPLYLGLYFLGQRQWKAVLGVGIGFGALNGAAIAAFGWSAYDSFFLDIAPGVAKEFQAYWPNASISGFFKKNLDGSVGHVEPWASLPQLATILSLLSVGLITLAAGWKAYLAESTEERDRAIAACVLGMLLASPITWDHYFVMLTPFLGILWLQSRSVGERLLLLTLIVVLFFVRPTWIWDAAIPGDGELATAPGDIVSVANAWQAITVLSYQFYGLLILWVISMRRRELRVES